MHPKHERKHETYTAKTATPITIDACGNSRPNPATISISANGGADFNASYACTLTFQPSCPFQNASGNQLALAQGRNDEPLATNAVKQGYKFTINPPQKKGQVCPSGGADPQDIIINS